MADADGRRARGAEPRSTSRSGRCDEDLSPSSRSSASTTPSSAWATTLSSGTRRALAEAMVTDVLDALRRGEQLDGVVVVTGEAGAQNLARALRRRVLDDDEPRPERRRARSASPGRSRAASSACCSCPATARR